MSEDELPRPNHPAAGIDAEYLDELYRRWQADPSSVGASWDWFFLGFDLAACPRSCVAVDSARDQSQVASLIYAYRDEGHRIARTNPLEEPPEDYPRLSLEQFGFDTEDLDRVFDTGHLGGPSRATLGEILEILRDTYCRSIGVEYLHIQDVEVRRWLQSKMEPARNRLTFDAGKKREILSQLVDAELFETFLQSRFLGQKRFSLEGAESFIPGLHAIVELAPAVGVAEIVMGMAHRGRLNVLANILDKSYEEIFSEFEDIELGEAPGGGKDVKYHKGYSADHTNKWGQDVHVSLTTNPSHLEAVDPVVEGRTRARQRRLDDRRHRSRVLPLLVHGDAAFAGQGLVAETLNLSQLGGYRTGGTVHLIINNQIGFTTLPSEGRSTAYATDLAKGIEAPILHVNGDDPEAVVYACELALVFRQEFHRDVVVDLICYRRHGHNEADDPAFTQPVMYAKIEKHASVLEQYTRRLIDDGVLDAPGAKTLEAEFKARLEEALARVKRAAEDAIEVQLPEVDPRWVGLLEPYDDRVVETGVDRELLLRGARAITRVPDGFAIHRRLGKLVERQWETVREQGTVDWGLAEALSFASLLHEGTPVRLSGQDSQRGTFSHRHAVWTDTRTQQRYIPLNHLREGQARFCVYNSMLSEAAVLGFDYGYSLDEPGMLILWEAQFGDFANGAQVIIDQFVTSAMAKWGRASGLVMLLPHGNEGQGPEHSNAYLERYLAAGAEDNIQVCNLTTPAQYFHVLRRQMHRPFRRPLIIMSPKSLLRHPRCVSTVDDLAEGHFQEVLDDPDAPAAPRRLALCSGKVYYDLLAARDEGAGPDVALVRVEQLYPLPGRSLRALTERYAGVGDVAWVQEETRNRGAWSHLAPQLREAFPDVPLRYVGRPAAASPATGSMRVHRQEQQQLVHEALSGESDR